MRKTLQCNIKLNSVVVLLTILLSVNIISGQQNEDIATGIELQSVTTSEVVSENYVINTKDDAVIILGYTNSGMVIELPLTHQILAYDNQKLSKNISSIVSLDDEFSQLEIAFVSKIDDVENVMISYYQSNRFYESNYQLVLEDNSTKIESIQVERISNQSVYLIDTLQQFPYPQFQTILWVPSLNISRHLGENLITKSLTHSSSAVDLIILQDNSHFPHLRFKSNGYNYEMSRIHIRDDGDIELTKFLSSDSNNQIMELQQLIVLGNHLYLLGSILKSDNTNIYVMQYKFNSYRAELVSKSIIDLKLEQHFQYGFLLSNYTKYRDFNSIIISATTIKIEYISDLESIREFFPIIGEIQITNTDEFELLWLHEELQGSKYRVGMNSIRDGLTFFQEFETFDDSGRQINQIIEKHYIFNNQWSERNDISNGYSSQFILLVIGIIVIPILYVLRSKIIRFNH